MSQLIISALLPVSDQRLELGGALSVRDVSERLTDRGVGDVAGFLLVRLEIYCCV